MLVDYFDQLPPELILLFALSLSTESLNSLILTCHRLHEILQPELETRLTLEIAPQILLWAAASNAHVVRKLLSPPYSSSPAVDRWHFAKTPLHVAAEPGNLETAALLLDAGANPAAAWDQEELQPLHIAAKARNLEMVTLLLDHGAPIDDPFGCDGCSETALHYACAGGDLATVELLLARGASVQLDGHIGPALGFAVRSGHLEVAKCLLRKGADATITVPLFAFLDGAPPPPLHANLLYVAMGLRHPLFATLRRRAGRELSRWEGLPLDENTKQLMALLLAHGASKDEAMSTISRHLPALANAAGYTDEDFLEMVNGMIREAEDAIPDVLRLHDFVLK
ncbi:ankyrin repeat-containing domain protein [Mycena galericulata]|nr:ankyrin repeat-containing domain protein [Mycena galericulata]